jgi:hypothetical protein
MEGSRHSWNSNLIQKICREKKWNCDKKIKRGGNSRPLLSVSKLRAGDGGGQPLFHRLTEGVLPAWPTEWQLNSKKML